MVVSIVSVGQSNWLGGASFPNGLLPSDVLVYMNVYSEVQNVNSVSGIGATWVAATPTAGRVVVWVGTNPSNVGGDVTINPNPTSPMSFGGSYAASWAIRGLASADVSNVGYVEAALNVATPAFDLAVGQVMLAAGILRGGADVMPAAASLPNAGAWTRNPSFETAQAVVTSPGPHRIVATSEGTDRIGYMTIGSPVASSKMRLGSGTVPKAYLGSTPVDKIYLGTSRIL